MNEANANESSRMAPEESFPEDLTLLDSSEVAVLNSRVHRAIDSEYIEFGLPDPESQARLAELTEELDRRDETGRRTAPAAQNQAAGK
ncbi:MAG: hypothetical protein AVDCRST_MAG83-3334 [uncultured Arthrobacter sp.]|uniref:Uncharacterized protein n=1 Tax=uncultured Arthrobacter sp. TaxID=114050 RepID=A0A6J4J9Z7_9MICC|nr:hypothetical protein [uncultured Arthrobacter sp.]CAA9271951.1 MAG: hypothetical protein AVDCRST_MAG83-3334 [uncultured Arthrobacter sp.]